jgi:hypothetical protein
MIRIGGAAVGWAFRGTLGVFRRHTVIHIERRSFTFWVWVLTFNGRIPLLVRSSTRSSVYCLSAITCLIASSLGGCLAWPVSKFCMFQCMQMIRIAFSSRSVMERQLHLPSKLLTTEYVFVLPRKFSAAHTGTK